MFNETNIGFEFKTQNHLVFYGKKNCSIENLESEYKNFKFRQVKQTHSDILIESVLGSEDIEADAHFTSEKNVALVVRTADCIPAMIYDENKNIILSVHAGWRGVQNKITLKSLKKLNMLDNIKIYIGPHIQKQSFKVDIDVKELLVKSEDEFDTFKNKYCVDLKNILIKQIQTYTHPEFYFLDKDTVTDVNFNSYRRDKENCGRNLSFIVKL